MVQLACKGDIKNFIFILLLFILIRLLLGCFVQKEVTSQVSKNDCILGKDFQLTELKGQYVVLSFYNNGELMSFFHRYNKPVDIRHHNFEFQYGGLCVFFHKAFPPINEGKYVYIFKGDTMFITLKLAYKINHYIDSIPFKKGNFEIILDHKELYNDPLYERFMEAVYSPFLIDSIQSLYSIYVKSKGVNFSEYFNEIQRIEKPSNPFANYHYCQTSQDTTKPKSAKNYIHDVLNEMFIEVKIDSMIQFE